MEVERTVAEADSAVSVSAGTVALSERSTREDGSMCAGCGAVKGSSIISASSCELAMGGCVSKLREREPCALGG